MSAVQYSSSSRVALVTGATNGIGRAAALALAERSHHVVVAGRDRGRVDDVVTAIRRRGAEASGEVADLSELSEVRVLADRVLERHRRPSVLLANAGAMFRRRELTTEGLEKTFALNHLACFLLTRRLLAGLGTECPLRIVIVASSAHHRGVLDPNDLQNDRAYSLMRAYGDSKLANLQFTYALARRLEGSSVTVNAMHPGLVSTGIVSANGGWMRWGMALVRPFLRSPRRGADTAVWLATDPEVEGENGGYYVDRRRVPSSARSQDLDAQEWLWRVSEDLCGLDPWPARTLG